MEMNSHAQALLFFILLLAAFSSTSPTALPQSDSEKVSLTLYYETLCPYSAKFIINYLNKLVNDDEMMKVVDLRLVPYGNAQIFNGTIICQVCSSCRIINIFILFIHLARGDCILRKCMRFYFCV